MRALPPSDEGGVFCTAKDRGREKVSRDVTKKRIHEKHRHKIKKFFILFCGDERMRGSAIFRFCAVCVVCFTVFLYNLVFNLHFSGAEAVKTKDEAASESFSEEKPKETQTQSAAESAESKAEEKEASKPESGTAVTTSAAAVKGKIEERYISPYNAALSYSNVYVKNNTSLKIDLKKYLTAPISFKIKKNDSPQVLILHTHATETYMTENTAYYTASYTSRTTDKSKNMCKIGDIVAEKLNAAGIKTFHDTTLHDYPNYTGSYSNAAETITSYLKKYPSIKVVLDLHRDAISSQDGVKTKVTKEINGKKAAQVMLVMGSQSGGVTNFPNWEENFKLALRVHKEIEESCPGLARPLTLNSKNYNESLTKGSLLIEFGTDANTLEEACLSARLVGEALAKALGKLT